MPSVWYSTPLDDSALAVSQKLNAAEKIGDRPQGFIKLSVGIGIDLFNRQVIDPATPVVAAIELPVSATSFLHVLRYDLVAVMEIDPTIASSSPLCHQPPQGIDNQLGRGGVLVDADQPISPVMAEGFRGYSGSALHQMSCLRDFRCHPNRS